MHLTEVSCEELQSSTGHRHCAWRPRGRSLTFSYISGDLKTIEVKSILNGFIVGELRKYPGKDALLRPWEPPQGKENEFGAAVLGCLVGNPIEEDCASALLACGETRTFRTRHPPDRQHEAQTLFVRSAEPSVAAEMRNGPRLWTPVVLDAVSVHAMKRSDSTG